MTFPKSIHEMDEENLNTNSMASATSSVDTVDETFISYCVIARSGGNSNHVCVLECSPDEINWYEMPDTTLTGLGAKFSHRCTFRYVRVKVKTPESSASTVRIFIQAK